MIAKRTTWPNDFGVTDAHRKWALDKFKHLGPKMEFLPDAAFSAFREYHETRIDEQRPARYANWTAAFQRFMRTAAPSGDMHMPKQWDRWLEKMKRKFAEANPPELDLFRPTPPRVIGYVNGQPVKTGGRPTPDIGQVIGNTAVGRRALDQMAEILGGKRDEK
jgi:hypothetical protein